MSAGMIWYKTQPDASIASVSDRLLSEIYGGIVSHDITVQPQKIGTMIANVFSRCNTVIIVGGLNTVKFEENIIYILSRVLGIPIENGVLSRSHHCCDTIRGTRLPSLAGSILFPSRFGGPEGILLKAGSQTIIVLPADAQSAKAITLSMHKFLVSRIRSQQQIQKVAVHDIHGEEDYRKFKNGATRKNAAATREYDEFELQNAMETAIGEMRRREGRIPESIADDCNRGDRDESFGLTSQEQAYFRRRAKIKKARNIFSLSLVLVVLCFLMAAGNFADIPTFASSIKSEDANYLLSSDEQKNNAEVTTETPSTTESQTHTTDEQTTVATTETTTTKKTTTTSKKSTTKKTTTTSKKSTTKKTTTTSKKSTTKKTTTTSKSTTAKTTTVSKTTTQKSTTAKTTTTTKAQTSFTMRIKSNGKVVSGDAVTILASIIEAEMGSSYNIEALKAQAVAAYTFYLYSGGSSKAPSFPTKTPGTRAKKAAKAVLGQKMTYNGKTPYTPYYAISAGKTASNATINGTSIAYLKSVDCSSDKNASGYKVIKTYSAAQVAKKVKANTGIDLTTISNKNNWFSIVSRDSNGLYVEKVKVGSKTYRGSKLWLSILGSSYLRSACYYISYNSKSDTFTFTSYGYGHGVGMSQKGANAYAAQGKDYKWILKHFYGGVSIV